MSYAFFPFGFYLSKAAGEALGGEAHRVAILALRAMLKHRKSLEVAHQQVRYCGRDFAFCSRITGSGQLVIEMDVGDPRLADVLILEDDLRRAERKVKGLREERPRRR
jgi:hypothetical protein